MAGSIDLSNPKDAGLVNEFARQRPKQFPKMNAEFKDELADALREAVVVARRAIRVPETAIAGSELAAKLVSVGIRMNDANMTDEHHAIDAARGAGENRTDNRIVVIQAPSARTMSELREAARAELGVSAKRETAP